MVGLSRFAYHCINSIVWLKSTFFRQNVTFYHNYLKFILLYVSFILFLLLLFCMHWNGFEWAIIIIIRRSSLFFFLSLVFWLNDFACERKTQVNKDSQLLNQQMRIITLFDFSIHYIDMYVVCSIRSMLMSWFLFFFWRLFPSSLSLSRYHPAPSMWILDPYVLSFI